MDVQLLQSIRYYIKKRKEYRKLITKYLGSWQQTRGYKPTRILISFNQIPLYQQNLVENGGLWRIVIDSYRQLQTVADNYKQLQIVINSFIQLSIKCFTCDGARARYLPSSAMLLPYSANLRLARLPLAPQRLPLHICLLWSLRPPSFLLLSLVSSLDSNPQALVQGHLCEPSHHQDIPTVTRLVLLQKQLSLIEAASLSLERSPCFQPTIASIYKQSLNPLVIFLA